MANYSLFQPMCMRWLQVIRPVRNHVLVTAPLPFSLLRDGARSAAPLFTYICQHCAPSSQCIPPHPSPPLLCCCYKWQSVLPDASIALLYNFSTKSFFGPFRAASNPTRQLEPQAWGGRFPLQVRVHPCRPDPHGHGSLCMSPDSHAIPR